MMLQYTVQHVTNKYSINTVLQQALPRTAGLPHITLIC
jgi:hypothetical protein